jgi:hypothetical protein
LRLKPGDRLDFVVGEDERVYILPGNLDVEALGGLLYKKGRAAISIDAMNAAIQQGGGAS